VRKNHIDVRVEAGDLRWLSSTRWISMGKIERRVDGWYSLSDFVGGPVTVEMTSSMDASLAIEDRQLENLLLNGQGCYAIKTEHAEFPIKGNGDGLWEILDH